MRQRCALPSLAAFFLAVLLASAAAAEKDYPLLGRLPNYQPGGYEERAFDAVEFPVKHGAEVAMEAIEGRRVSVGYVPVDAKKPASDADIQRNYRATIGKLGGQVLYAEAQDTTGVVKKDGKEIWLGIHSGDGAIDLIIVEKGAFKPSLLPPKAPDHPLFGRMPNYDPGKPQRSEADSADFDVQSGDDQQQITVDGRKFVIDYELKDGAPQTSDVEIQRNYRQRLAELDADILYLDGETTEARVLKDGEEYFVAIHSEENTISILVLQKKPHRPPPQAVKAGALKEALEAQGHVPIYIDFDTAKSALKPDATPLLQQIVALLQANPGWKLRIEGHTDVIGKPETNKTLSEARAQSVLDFLVAAGIDKSRLSPAGFGGDQPIADNATEEGRAQNRRIELVKL